MPDPDRMKRAASELIPEIYSAALDPSLWEKVVERIRLALEAHSGMLAISFPRSGQGTVLASSGFTPEVLGIWESHHALSPWARAALGRAEGEAGLGSELVPTDEIMASSMGRELLAPQGLRDMVGVLVARSPLMIGHLTFYDGRLFGAPELALMNALAPHLVRAVALHHRIAWLAEGAGAFAGGIDAIPHGLFLVDEHCLVVHANRAGEGLLDEQDGLVLQEGRLAASRTDDSNALARAVRAVTHGGGQPDAPQLVEMAATVRRPSGLRAYHVLATPSLPSRAGLVRRSGSGPLALVWVSDPESRAVPSAAVVGRLLGLTPAESRLAVAIAAGQTVREYAASANVRENTARTTLKQVLEKTGAHRQVELVRMILTSIPATFGDAAGGD